MQQSRLTKSDRQCPVCYEDGFQLKPVCRNSHQICERCIFSLRKRQCPICKESFRLDKTQGNNRGFAIIYGQEDNEHDGRSRQEDVQLEQQEIRRYYEYYYQNYYVNLHQHHQQHQNYNHNHNLHTHHNQGNPHYHQGDSPQTRYQHSHSNINSYNNATTLIPLAPTQNHQDPEQYQYQLASIANLSEIGQSQLEGLQQVEGEVMFVQEQNHQQGNCRYYSSQEIMHNPRDPHHISSEAQVMRLLRRQRDQLVYDRSVRRRGMDSKEEDYNDQEKKLAQKDWEQSIERNRKSKGGRQYSKQRAENSTEDIGILGKIGQFFIKIGEKLSEEGGISCRNVEEVSDYKDEIKNDLNYKQNNRQRNHLLSGRQYVQSQLNQAYEQVHPPYRVNSNCQHHGHSSHNPVNNHHYPHNGHYCHCQQLHSHYHHSPINPVTPHYIPQHNHQHNQQVAPHYQHHLVMNHNHHNYNYQHHSGSYQQYQHLPSYHNAPICSTPNGNNPNGYNVNSNLNNFGNNGSVNHIASNNIRMMAHNRQINSHY